jgi:hypothetical protein
MRRHVAPETLDGLAESDPLAMRSRRDLKRIHLAMRTRSIVLRGLRGIAASHRGATPLRVLELGAGDGTLMLGVAKAFAPTWPRVELTLLDRQDLVERATLERYAHYRWSARPAVLDVHEWVAGAGAPATQHWDLVVANLFLHHFEGQPLVALLDAIASRTERFFACEPRRARLALLGSHLVGALGANAVTRADAVLSVHAGFCGSELTATWPTRGSAWKTREYSAGLFSHCFAAERVREN